MSTDLWRDLTARLRTTTLPQRRLCQNLLHLDQLQQQNGANAFVHITYYHYHYHNLIMSYIRINYMSDSSLPATLKDRQYK